MNDRSWILDVVKDVRAFARENQLPQLDAKLDEVLRVAMAEIRLDPKEDLDDPNSVPIGRNIKKPTEPKH